MSAVNVIKRPILSEKSTRAAETFNQVAFEVTVGSTKPGDQSRRRAFLQGKSGQDQHRSSAGENLPHQERRIQNRLLEKSDGHSETRRKNRVLSREFDQYV